MSGPRTLFVRKSANAKIGPMPTTYTAAATCPDACPLKGGGCYASAGFHTRLAWARADRAPAESWGAFLAAVRALPAGTLWRHNVAGDLPGEGNTVDVRALADLVDANTGRRGFTYTHKPPIGPALEAIRSANAAGFTINLSANNLAHADKLAELQAGPVTALVPADFPATGKTPAGRTVVVCPEQTGKRASCLECGACQVSRRKPIIGFRIHGAQSAKALSVARGES